jgi:uncharacterized protein (TIGR04255 family)
MVKVPKVLAREPLVDAVFEVRLQAADQLADILPGYLLHELGSTTKVTRLPAADIPRPMRADNPDLQFAPIQRLEWTDYLIAFGDRNIVISCKLPYPKWQNFKAAILDIVKMISKLDFGGRVERYSLKYVNLIQAATFAQQIEKIRTNITLGDVQVYDDHMSLQVHRKESDIIHILSVVTGAQGQMPNGNLVVGVLVDIDSIRLVDIPDFRTFALGLEPGLQELRDANKVKFFSCLKDATIDEMGPTYD